MRSIPLAITWEMLQRGRWWLIGGFLYQFLMPTLVFSGLLQVEGFDMYDPGMLMLHMLFPPLNMFVIAASIVAAQGSLSRLYVFPVQTSTIVASHMLIAMAAVSLEYSLSTALLNIVFKVEWPLWGPAMFVAATITVYQATLWFTEKTAWMPLAVCAVGGLLGYFYYTRFSLSDGKWHHLMPIEVAAMALMTIVSYIVGLAGVTRNRCGEQLKPLGIYAWLVRIIDIDLGLEPKFRTPSEAQYWFEWRRKGWALPIVVAFALVIWATFVLFFAVTSPSSLIQHSKELTDGLAMGGILLSEVGMMVGIFIGITDSRDSSLEMGHSPSVEMGHFLGSRPLTNTGIARAILKMIGKSVLISWGLWAATFAATLALMHINGLTIQLPDEVRWWHLPATLLGCWTVVATVASFFLAGRKELIAQIFCGIVVIFIGCGLLGTFVFSKETLSQISDALVPIYGVGFVAGYLWVFVAARKKRLIGIPTISVSLGLWLTLSLIAVFESMKYPGVQFSGCIFLVGLMALTVFPLAAAPLAVSFNRTR